MFQTIAEFLDGKKTVLGIAAGVIYLGLVGMNVMERNELVEQLIFAWTGVGVAHKFAKAT